MSSLGSPRNTDPGHPRVSAALRPIAALLEPDGSEAAGDSEDAGRGPGQSALLLVITDLCYLCGASKAQKVVPDVFSPI